MRHLDNIRIMHEKGTDQKGNSMPGKDEMPELPTMLPTIADVCNSFVKSEFPPESEGAKELNIGADSGEEFEESPFKRFQRRNKRKSLVPQKALQLRGVPADSYEKLSKPFAFVEENSLDLSGVHTYNDSSFGYMSLSENNLDLHESEELLKDLSEDDIFKDLQEEADGENFDEDSMTNVKEEWRAHWGVKCNMCQQVFSLKTEFDKHYKENYGITPVYTCTFCNKTAEKYSTFRSHCYRHITEGRHKCKECPKGFSLQSMLLLHVASKHTKTKPFTCEECGKDFVTKPGLNLHIKKHKTEIKEDYPCVECGKVLHTRGGLTSHMNVHRLGRRFMCDVCGKTFTQKVNMQQHVKQHTGDKPHGCDKCGKTFAEKSHLARHYSFHSDERPHKCEVCHKMYKTERCLKVHKMVHAAARPFVCDYCNKGFLSSTKLKQHYNIHTGERPYKCNYCEKTFTNYPNWLKHTRRRHNVDHRTGEDLKPKTPKNVVPKVEELQISELPDSIANADMTDQLLPDFLFSKNEELFLQQGLNLLNLPLTDEKFFIPQQLDFLTDEEGQLVIVDDQKRHECDAIFSAVSKSSEAASSKQLEEELETYKLQVLGVFNSIKTFEELNACKKLTDPMEPTLAALRVDFSKDKILQSSKNLHLNAKIVPQRRLFSTKRKHKKQPNSISKPTEEEAAKISFSLVNQRNM